MGDMRGDMGGAAVTFGAMYAAAKLKIPGKVIAVTPLAENMPAGNASKPGDVVVARNGKSIQIDNTDAEGRLLLCDALGKLTLTRPIGLPPHALVAQKVAEQCTLIASLVKRLFVRADWTERLRDDSSQIESTKFRHPQNSRDAFDALMTS